MRRMNLFWTAVLVCVLMFSAFGFATTAPAATIHFTASGVQTLGNAQAWGGSDITNRSTAFELTFDFTAATDAITNAITLLEGGGSGKGMAIVLDNDNLHFFAGDSVDDVLSVPHGLTAPTNDLQLVCAIRYDTSGSLDTYEIFINGVSLGTKSDINMNNDWAGTDSVNGLGTQGGTQRYNSTTLFDYTAMANFTDGDDDITFNLYDLTLPANDLSNILVPEPATIALLGFGLIGLARRRKR